MSTAAGDISVGVEDGIQIVRLTRAEKKNALTGAMYDAMSAALDAAEARADIAVTVFLGLPGAFCAGNDIADFVRLARSSDGGTSASGFSFIRRLPRASKPLVAAVDGLAIGIGTTLLLHCDLVYATPAASLRTPFLDLGLVPEAGSSLTAVLRMGHARAFELLCLGNAFDAERAREAGVVNAIVPAAELEATALAAARRLAAKPQGALAAARRLMRGDGALVAAKLEEEAAVFRARMASAEAQEAFAAFLEKRPPDFAKLKSR